MTTMTWLQAFEQIEEHATEIIGMHGNQFPLLSLETGVDVARVFYAKTGDIERVTRIIATVGVWMSDKVISLFANDLLDADSPARFSRQWCEWADEHAEPPPTFLPTGGREWEPDDQGGERFACKPGRVIE